MDDLKSALFQKFNIPVAEQELLLASGITPDPSKPAVQCCAEVVCYTYTIVYNKDMLMAPYEPLRTRVGHPTFFEFREI